MSEIKKEHKCPVCEAKKKQIPTGPDVYGGGDGLPDWMQFTITAGMFGVLIWILYLLAFHLILYL